MNDKKITLEKRGCNFWEKDLISLFSDIGNYRVGIYEYKIPGKDGNMYLVEFCNARHWKRRCTNKRTGQPLKKPVDETIIEYGLCVDTQHEVSETTPGGYTYNACYRNRELEREIWEKHLPFTRAGIAEALNIITGTNNYTAKDIIV